MNSSLSTFLVVWNCVLSLSPLFLVALHTLFLLPLFRFLVLNLLLSFPPCFISFSLCHTFLVFHFLCFVLFLTLLFRSFCFCVALFSPPVLPSLLYIDCSALCIFLHRLFCPPFSILFLPFFHSFAFCFPLPYLLEFLFSGLVFLLLLVFLHFPFFPVIFIFFLIIFSSFLLFSSYYFSSPPFYAFFTDPFFVMFS